MSRLIRWTTLAVVALALFLGTGRELQGYSVLSHEAVIDAVWKDSIVKLLLQRFPAATPEQLREARAYAYGGCIIQDMGYYPFGSHFFSDLLHYVRSGEFVESLLRQAQDPDEYAFALGALSHYSADTLGHPLAVNLSVPLMYPKLEAKYGHLVTYEEDPKKHLTVEFGFDVVQVAAGVYASNDYHEFIGFQVARPLLERAFKETYGLNLGDVLLSEDLALGTYRWAAGKTIPRATVVAWQLKKDEIEKLTPGITRQKFVYHFSRREYEKEYGKRYRGRRRIVGGAEDYKSRIVEAAHTPGWGAKILAIILSIIPRVGPLRPLGFKPPTPQAESMFLSSLNAVRQNYLGVLQDVAAGRVNLQDEDLDTGKPSRAGEYSLADETYADLLARLRKQRFQNAPPELRANIFAFYAGYDPAWRPKHCKPCRDVSQELDEMKQIYSSLH